jgi:hypothetical protein
MPASFRTLSNKTIGTVVKRTLGLVDGPNLMKNQNARSFQRSDDVGTKAKEEDCSSNFGCDANLHVRAPNEREKQVDRNRTSPRELASAIDLLGEMARRKQPNGTQATAP